MLIGKKDTFAVEYELDTNSGGQWMYGKICYWLEGKMIGDYKLGTSLRDVLFQLKYLVHDSGKRNTENLCSRSPENIFYQLNESIYGENEDTCDDIPDSPARFDIKIPVDVFDQWKIFLIDCSSYSTILYKKIDDKDVHVVRIIQYEFDDVISKLYNDLERKFALIQESDGNS